MNITTARTYFVGTLALIVIVSETYSMVALDQPLSRLGTGVIQAAIFSVIAWLGFSYGSKSFKEAYNRKSIIIGGLYVWAMSFVVFKILNEYLDFQIVSAFVPFILVGVLSYFAGKRGEFGFNNAKKSGS